MREWTEQEEQEMIELAKQGDPKANFELSQWALQRGEEEPDESRWNRLAAKCLVKSAQAGYAPAQERMQALLHQAQDPARQEPKKEEPAPREPVRLSDARAAAAARRGQSPAPESTARRPEPVPEAEDEDESFSGGDEPVRPRGGLRSLRGRRAPEPAEEPVFDDDEYYDDEEDAVPDGGSRWGEKQWRRVEIICVAVCALLLVLIAVMIITGRRGGDTGGGQSSAIPPAGDASGAVTATPEPEPYPDEATLAAIAAADLEVDPEESDYVTVPTTATVKVDSQTLRLRKGPSTTYTPPICNMEDGTVVQVYAIKNNWSLVYYEGAEDGPVYGWCSSEYLIVTAGAADNSSVG